MILLALLAQAFPMPVRSFEARQADCAHWRGEEPYDADRRAEIAAAIRAACRGLDTERVALLRRYRHRTSLIRHLRRYPPIKG